MLEIERRSAIESGTVRVFLTWLLALGMVAGLNLRAVAERESHASHASPAACAHEPHAEEQGHAHDSSAPTEGSHSDESDCPDHPHHHGACLHHLPLAMDEGGGCAIWVAHVFLGCLKHESDLPPEGPFLALDPPPLI